MGNEARNTVDSGIEFTENRHGPIPPQSEGWKQNVDDDTLLKAYADIPTNTRNMPWDGPHKRILIESDEPESEVFFYEAQTLHEHSTSSIRWRRVLVSTLSHRAGHSEVKRVA